jgi:hypothetical protein
MTARSVFNLHTPILYVRNATKIPINLRALFTFSSEIKTGFSQKHFSSVSSFRHSNICLHHPIQSKKENKMIFKKNIIIIFLNSLKKIFKVIVFYYF